VLAVRYAIYFSPAKDHPLTEAASRWLGRNAFSGTLYDDHDDYADMTEEPRRYGFHATLKAPFELAEKYSEAELLSAFEDFAASRSVFEIPRVVVGALGPFYALVPDRIYQPLQDFAAEIVDHFDRFRAPLSETDIARRRPQMLTESQRQNLSLWGYPHVMDDFRFHMTLTGRIDETEQPAMQEVLSARFSEFVDKPLTISGLALFIEETRGAPFTVHSWHPLGQPPKKDANP
jgi:putative phosphonate metabolism protein